MELIVSLVIGGVIGWATSWYFARKAEAENRDLRERLQRFQESQEADNRQSYSVLMAIATHFNIPLPSEHPTLPELRAAVLRSLSLSGTVQPTGTLTTRVIRGDTSPQEPPDAPRAPDVP